MLDDLDHELFVGGRPEMTGHSATPFRLMPEVGAWPLVIVWRNDCERAVLHDREGDLGARPRPRSSAEQGALRGSFDGFELLVVDPVSIRDRRTRVAARFRHAGRSRHVVVVAVVYAFGRWRVNLGHND